MTKFTNKPIDLLSTTDASVWASEFMRMFSQRLNEIDEGLMIAWFANAIETGRDAGKNESYKQYGI
jgi:hypothetical protein